MVDSAFSTFKKIKSKKAKDNSLKILTISASSGGGHHGVASSIIQAISQYYKIQETRLDLYADGKLKIYPKIAKVRASSPVLWASFITCTDNIYSISALWRWFRPSFTKSLIEQIKKEKTPKPDVIIATHHASAQCIHEISKSYKVDKPKTIVFVTDYGIHQNWIAPADLYVVASTRAYKRLKQQNYKVIKLPLLPCLPRFQEQPISKSIESNKTHFIAVMGLDGTSEKRLLKLLYKLDKLSFSENISIDIMCGNNNELFSRLSNIKWSRLEIKIYSFVDNLPEKLNQADLALLRLSPQIMTESIVAKTPIIAFDWHFHERENIEILKRFNVGAGSLNVNTQLKLIQDFCQNSQSRDNWQKSLNKISSNTINKKTIIRMLNLVDIKPSELNEKTDNLKEAVHG